LLTLSWLPSARTDQDGIEVEGVHSLVLALGDLVNAITTALLVESSASPLHDVARGPPDSSLAWVLVLPLFVLARQRPWVLHAGEIPRGISLRVTAPPG
jgi:hypothetical protein